MKKTFFLLLLTSSFLYSFAQRVDTKKLDSLFESLDKNQKWMGNFAMSINGSPLYSKAIGFADVATNKITSTSFKYRIGSISKTFTATLVLKAVEDHKVTLEDKLSKYFPSVKNADRITITNLLNHRSGIYNITSSPDYLKWNTQKKSSEEMVKLISSYDSDFEPNAKFAYSNSNYILLSYILEKVYNKPLKNILTEKITKPLGLKNTYLGEKIATNTNEVYSYSFTGSWIKETETDMSIPSGAGAVVSNPSDLNTFIESLFSGKLISASSLALMTKITDGYGFGLVPFSFKDKKGIGHNGGIDKFSSMLFYFPEDKLSIALISNGGAYSDLKIFTAALSSYYKVPFELPNFNIPELTSADLEQYLGEYSAPNFPLKVTVSKKDKILFAQASGQSEFPLNIAAKHTFEYEAAGIILEFNPALKQMILKQGAGKYVLTKN